MNLQHVNVKVFVDGDLTVDLERFIETFHRWVAEQSLAEMLIDVADYRHVPAGPGVVLIGLEADYSIDQTGNRPGLRYNRKAALEGDNADRFRQAFDSAVHACRKLEAELPELSFSRREFELFINDRALAPNTSETFSACRAELEAFLNSLSAGAKFQLEHDGDPRRLFGVNVKFAQPIELSGTSA